MTIRGFALMITMIVVPFLSGCSSHRDRLAAETQVGRTITARMAIGGHKLAIGGVLGDEPTHITGYPGDPESNAEKLLKLLRAAIPRRRYMTEAVLADLVTPEILEAVKSQYAATGGATRADLLRLGRDLGDIGRLIMARVETLNSGVEVRDFRLDSDADGGLLVIPLGKDAVRPLKGVRHMRVTLDIWDLGTGAHIWSAHTTVEDTFRTELGVHSLAAATRTDGRPSSRGNEALDRALICLVDQIGNVSENALRRPHSQRRAFVDPLR